MERVERIGGEKYHLNRLSQEELENIRAHTIARMSGLMHDVEVLEAEIATRMPYEMPQLEATPVYQQHFEARFGETQ